MSHWNLGKFWNSSSQFSALSQTTNLRVWVGALDAPRSQESRDVLGISGGDLGAEKSAERCGAELRHESQEVPESRD